MIETEILKLMEEKEHFRRLAEEDRLTGLYNRGATEEKINEQLSGYKEGVLFVIDVNDFKKVNDRYGHLIGDGLLKEIARRLLSAFLKSDVIGRIGGDEFVVFLSVKQDESFASERAKQIKDLIRNMEVKTCRLDITVSVGYSVYRDGDDYQSLFDRADQNLIAEKRDRKRINFRRNAATGGIEMDVLRIQSELKEYKKPKGAYFQGYDFFKTLYRYTERRFQRLDGTAYIVLMTLTDGDRNLLPLDENIKWMECLKEIICRQLRAGDAFAQYSSCQYLIMLADVSADESEAVAGRVKAAFYQKAENVCQKLLLHHCFPLGKGKCGHS